MDEPTRDAIRHIFLSTRESYALMTAVVVLPAAIRLVELTARIPWYQRETLRWLAKRDATTVDAVLSRELEDVASAHAGELVAAVPGFERAMGWVS